MKDVLDILIGSAVVTVVMAALFCAISGLCSPINNGKINTNL